MRGELTVDVDRRPDQSAQVTLRGSVDAHTFGRLSDAFSGLARADTLWIVADLSEMTYISSVGLNFLVHTRVSLCKRGGELVLVNPQPQVHKIFKMLGLLDIFVLAASVEEAWARIKGKPQPSA